MAKKATKQSAKKSTGKTATKTKSKASTKSSGKSSRPVTAQRHEVSAVGNPSAGIIHSIPTPAPTLAVIAGGQLNIDGDADPVLQGSHPAFDDLERVEILNKTASMVKINPALERLHALLSDAHERLSESTSTEDVDALQKDLDEAQAAEKEADEECGKMEKELETAREAIVALESREKSGALGSLEWEKALEEHGDLIRVELGAEHDKAVAKLTAQVAELKEVEPLAAAFAVLAAVELDSEKLSDEDAEVVKTALKLMGIVE